MLPARVAGQTVNDYQNTNPESNNSGRMPTGVGGKYDRNWRIYKSLKHYYSDARKDNFTIATPEGIRVAAAGGYKRVRIEGYFLKSLERHHLEKESSKLAEIRAFATNASQTLIFSSTRGGT